MKSINLRKKEIDYLHTFVKKGNKKAREITRARILLLTNKKKKDNEIQEILGVGRSTIWRARKNYLKKGIDYALAEKERPGQPKKYNKKKKAEIIAYACTDPPNGRKRWTVRLLAEELSKRKGFETINRESIRLTLKKAILNLG